MSLVAPQHIDAPGILRWSNNFSWSYANDVADSIKQRVKRAGGNVTGDVRVSLSWASDDDFDVHSYGPRHSHIYYGTKQAYGGRLDVDMHVYPFSFVPDPVENITWSTLSRMPDGEHRIEVHNYTLRNSDNPGFEIEVEIQGNVTRFNHPSPLRDKAVVCTLVKYQDEVSITPADNPNIRTGSLTQEQWGVQFNDWTPVNMMMLSPNHWDDNVGNKHYFFILDKCVNPDPVRGLYNEFLSPKLNEHRKVFEVLAAKTKCQFDAEQLSGVGFSSTQPAELLVRVKGTSQRELLVQFG